MYIKIVIVLGKFYGLLHISNGFFIFLKKEKIQSKIVFAKDVRTVLTYVDTGNVDAGLVYKTDAAVSKKVKILATAPDGSHAPIIYPAAVLTGTKNQKAAEEFLSYLAGPEGKSVFEKHGFVMGK